MEKNIRNFRFDNTEVFVKGSFDSALKRFKRTMGRHGVLGDLKTRRLYPGVKDRRRHKKWESIKRFRIYKAQGLRAK